MIDALLLVERIAREAPGRCAVGEHDRAWTYGQLWHASQVLAGLIRGSNTATDRPIALWMHKGPALVAAMLAVVHTRRFFVVIDPAYPVSRNQLVIEDADPSLLLSDGSAPAQERTGTLRLEVPALETLCEQTLIQTAAPEPGEPDDLACLVYTSGSTGRPKGVMIPRGALTQIAMIQSGAIGIGPQSRLSLLSSASVYGGMRTIWGALPIGASIHPYSIENQGLDGLRDYLTARRISVLHCTPSVLRHFASVLESGERFEGVDRLILGADRVLAEDIRLARRILSRNVNVWTGLGASETGTVSGELIGPDAPLPSGAMPLGAPVDGRRLLLLDDEGRIVATGETGELFVEGSDIALGYWRQPERTAEAFTPGSQPGSRRFRTSDLARLNDDGALLHMGRRDFVVKVRGVRVDLGEVEGVLASHGNVRECAIIACATDDEQQLAAFVELNDGTSAEPLREFLGGRLPPAMQPRQFFVVTQWPKTASGKLDRRALHSQIDWNTARDDTDAAALLGGMEILTADIWSQVLGRAISNRNAHFLESGGNSLTAMRVSARVARTTGRRIAATALLHKPVLKDFAALVEAAPHEAGEAPAAPATALTEAPLSPAQESLWLLEQLEGVRSTYNISLPLRLRGPLHLHRLADALFHLQSLHEALRVRIEDYRGAPRQVLEEPTSPAGFLEELAPQQVAGEQTLQEHMAMLAGIPLETTDGRLWRAKVLGIAKDDHVLLLTFHHIICDGWSLQILVEDLSRLYSGDPPAMLDRHGSFLSLAARSHTNAAMSSPSRDYWRRLLENLENLSLPAGVSAAISRSTDGAVERMPLPDGTAEAVNALCQQAGCTAFSVHLAAFQILLGRYCSQNDFGIGIPAAERQDEALENIVGHLVNMLVFRAGLSPEQSFRDVVATTHRQMLEALEHQSIAFEQVVKDLAPVREPGRNPLFQVAMAVQNQPRGHIHFEGLHCAALESHNGQSKFDLTLEYGETDGSAWIEFEYRTDIFDQAAIRSLGAGYMQLLATALQQPDSRASHLPVIGPDDEALLAQWNRTDLDFPGPRVLPELVLRQCRLTPDAVAIVSPEETLTYARLAGRIEAAALHLMAGGLRPGEVVATQVARSADLIITALGIMKAGGIYLPLDPDWPPQRTERILHDAGARHVWRGEALAAPAGEVTSAAVEPDSLAYLLYTSGSTGQPKGVEVGHAGLCNQLRWFCSVTDMTPADAMLFKTSPTFDASLVEMFAPLVAGARVVIGDAAGDLDPAQLAATIEREGITVLQSVPSACRALLATGRLQASSRLRYLVLGGEALDIELAQCLHQTLPALRIGNFYGPTETTIDAVQHEIIDWTTKDMPIGRPIANMRCHVLDAGGQPQPVGAWGELCIAGIGVARGYRGQPDLSARSFMDDPFAPHGRMYRSGDRARWTRDGVIEFAGRSDDQVKIRGLRMELGEIETALRSLAGVAQAVVMKDGEQLLGFVEPVPDANMDVSVLRTGLGSLLPQYMLPARLIVVPELPMLASGKLNRTALKELAAASDAIAVRVEPRNRLERALLEIWQDCLGVQHLGVEDDFFAAGGHSLLAFQVVQKIREQLERACSLRMLFENPTIGRLAIAMEEDIAANQGGVVLPLQPHGSATPVYCICGIGLYRHFAEALGPDIPVRGVYLPWEEKVLANELSADGFTVAGIASRYLDVILASQPQGPFILAGLSFGGLLAFEMARQASERGISVPLLIILDVPPYEARHTRSFELGEMKAAMHRWMQVLWARCRGVQLGPELQYELFNQRRLKLYGKVRRSHVAGPYAGKTLVVRSEERIGRGIGNDPALGWRRHVPDIHTVDVPGTHLGVVQEPGVRIIASQMRRLLGG